MFCGGLLAHMAEGLGLAEVESGRRKKKKREEKKTDVRLDTSHFTQAYIFYWVNEALRVLM